MTNSADLIRKWFDEVWNQGLEETIDTMCSSAAIGHGQTHDGSDIVGPAHFKQFWQAFHSGFSAIHFEIDQTVQEGEWAMARWSVTMKHTGTFLQVPPTGKQITARGMSLQRFVDGKIVEAWDNWDQLGVFVQLGTVSLEKAA